MATITKRKNGWCVQVRRKGYAARNRTLPTKTEALAWGREQEGLIDKGQLPVTEVQLKVTTLAQLIGQYRSTVTPTKRSSETEGLRLGRMMGDKVMDRMLIDLEPGDFASYRDRRLKLVKPGTVRRELYLFANAIDIATKEWGYPFRTNPVRLINMPIANDARDRRLEEGEAEALREALSTNRNPFIRPIVELAIETGLRRREVLELARNNVDVNSPEFSRHLPLSKSAAVRTRRATASRS